MMIRSHTRFPCILVTVFLINACIAKEPSLRDEANNYCEAYNQNNYSPEEKTSIQNNGQSQTVNIRISKAAHAPLLQKVIKKVLESEYEYSFYEGLQIFISEEIGEKWGCPYFPTVYEVEHKTNNSVTEKQFKVLPLSIGDFETHKKNIENPKTQIITIDKSNNIYAEDIRLESNDIQNISKALKSIASIDGITLLINSDSDASVQSIVSVLAAAKEAGINQVYFVVQSID